MTSRDLAEFPYWVNVGVREQVDGGDMYCPITELIANELDTWTKNAKLQHMRFPTGAPTPSLWLFSTEADLMLFILRWNGLPVPT